MNDILGGCVKKSKIKFCLLICLIGITLFFATSPLSASTALVPLSNECLQVGQAQGCSFLPEFGSKGSVNLLPDSSVQAVGSQGDIPAGIQNNSSFSYVNHAAFTGSNSIFLTGRLRNRKSPHYAWGESTGGGNDDCEDGSSDGGSCAEACDSKEGDSESCGGEGEDDDHESVTPEPVSFMLLGTGLVVLGWGLRRKLLS